MLFSQHYDGSDQGGKDNNKNTISSNSFQSFTSRPLNQSVENFWEIESCGMKHKETSSTFSKEEQSNSNSGKDSVI